MRESWSGKASCRISAAVLTVGALAACANADALVVTKAMQASTIAELFVNEGQVRVELEVGAADLPAFANLLPDDAYERLRRESRPLQDRLKAFFNSDWIIQADKTRLPGRVEDISLGQRMVRDEVTGEPTPGQPSDAAHVLRISLRYDLGREPDLITIQSALAEGESPASIGFMCYHQGLPVNDFRYLPGEVTLDLDWEDPWYSSFRNRNLRRRFDAPMSAFLYVEPYEVRKEIVLRPIDLRAWLDLGLEEGGVIPIDQQPTLKQQVAQFLSERNPVTIDGQVGEPRLDRIHFIRRSLRTTGIIEPPEELDMTSATLGVIFVYPVASLPQQVSMQWELFSPKIQAVPTVASDEAGGLPSEVTPEFPVLEWNNYLTNPTVPRLLSVQQPPEQRRIAIPGMSLLCGVVAIACGVVFSKQKSAGQRVSKSVIAALTTSLVGGVLAFPVARFSVANPFSPAPQVAESEGKQILASLLHNVYRSFDHHDESVIYDRLAQSISGELLQDAYLETRRSMEVKNQGGLRISVKEVEVTDARLVEAAGTDATFRCRWRVSGWIGHWGHTHRRQNEHVALITIAPRDEQWKMTAMELLDEQSLDEPDRAAAAEGPAA